MKETSPVISIKKYWRGALILAVAILFFSGTASYNYISNRDGLVKWAAPDENANYIFSKLYAETGELKLYEKYNLYVNDVIVPRSFRSDAGVVKPVSFLGMILVYGEIVHVIGTKFLPYLTPFFASLGIIFFYLLLKKIFHRNNALISTLLLASFPPYIYYTARSMFHNVFFVVLVIVGLNYLVQMVDDVKSYKKIFFSALAGLFLGLAVITRTSELMWLLPILIFIWLPNFFRVPLPRVLIFLAFFLTSLLPAIYYNKILYGSYLLGGYTEMNQSLVTLTKAGSDLITTTATAKFSQGKKMLHTIINNVFYFGFHPRQSLRMVYYYFVDMFFWIFWPALGGLIWLLYKRKTARARHWLYLGVGFILSFILLLYYGSWEFHDNPDPSSFTIGNSYTRYWLPVYLCAFPLVSLFIMKLTTEITRFVFKDKQKESKKFWSASLNKKIFLGASRTVIVVLIIFISLQFVLVGSAEGLVFSSQRHIKDKEEIRSVLALTEDNAVIITRYHDKFLFPERKVIVGLFDQDKMLKHYQVLASELPVYYYNFTFPEKDFEYLNLRRLPEFNLQIKEVKKITSDFTLYRLEEKQE